MARAARQFRPAAFLSRHGSTVMLFAVVAVELAVGMFVIRDLRSANFETQRMYAGSVLGLRRIGEMQYQSQETRRSTLYALTTNDSNLQVEYADQSRSADQRVSDGIAEYSKQAQTPQERKLASELANDWSAYLKVRDEVLASILEGSTKEAVELDLTGGVPSFERVRQDLDEIKRLYDEQASERLAHVAASAHRSVLRLIVVLMFTLIFASVAIWAIQRSRLQSALQLARLQMEFVASVSHELRTPLAVLCSAADNLADGVVGSREQFARYCALIRKQSRQITELVNQILLFSSTQESHERFVMRSLEVSPIIASAVESTAAAVGEAGFKVEQQIASDLPHIVVDPNALSQCLQNLITNAVKYGGEDRWVSIRAGEADGADDSREVIISVEDHGIGIDPQELPRIFEPFYRSPAVSSSPIHGTGLGLAVAKSIAEALGGRLSVVSTLGAGSTFTLHLPVAGKGDLALAAAASGPDLVTKK
ncbi:MAG TPA: ATP-binding protein [Terriglobales bacterium]